MKKVCFLFTMNQTLNHNDMANEITQLENRFIINSEECQYVVDTTPVEGSNAFITSGAVYDVKQSVSEYIGRHVVDTVDKFTQNNTDIPTVGLIWQILKNNNVI